MQYSSGRHEILLIFSIIAILAGLSLDGVVWYVRLPLVIGALAAAVIAARDTWNESDS